MSGVNKVILVGHLGQDPEIRATASGTKVASVSLATSESWKDKDGQKQERTEWHKLVIWSRLAEVAERYTKKGDQIYIEGKLQTRSWDDQNGQKRYMTEVVVQSLQMLGKRDADGHGRQEQSRDYGPPGTPGPGYDVPPIPEEDSLPF